MEILRDLYSVTTVAGLAGGIAVLLLSYAALKAYLGFNKRQQICKKFGLNSLSTRILRSDLGGEKYRSFYYDEIYSLPDSVFECQDGLVVGELKSGKQIKLRDFYQLTIYMQACSKHFGRNVSYGILAYRHKKYRCRFDPHLYEALKRLVRPALKARKTGKVDENLINENIFHYKMIDFIGSHVAEF